MLLPSTQAGGREEERERVREGRKTFFSTHFGLTQRSLVGSLFRTRREIEQNSLHVWKREYWNVRREALLIGSTAMNTILISQSLWKERRETSRVLPSIDVHTSYWDPLPVGINVSTKDR